MKLQFAVSWASLTFQKRFPDTVSSKHRPCIASTSLTRSLIATTKQNIFSKMSLVIRKPAFSICENKDADQLRGNREADQRLCFRYTDSTIPLLPKSKISSLYPSSVVVQPGLCGTWSETPKTGFLRTRLI